ncbi:MAG: imelysin family protein [Chitinophagales bacterium]
MKKFQLLLLATVLFFSACDDDDVINPLGNASDFVTNYANMAYANYNDALEDAKSLKTAIDAFVATPNATTHQAAKTAWLTARESYGTTEAFRFAGGPIDEYGEAPEGALNAWPLDEAYVDYIDNNGNIDNTGIINDGVTSIDAATLESLNEQGGEANISIGYHAIEFLLWGQDNTDPSVEMADKEVTLIMLMVKEVETFQMKPKEATT